MDRQLIETLIEALQLSGLSELEYTSGGDTLRLVKGGGSAVRAVPGPAPLPVPAAAPKPSGDGAVAAPLYGVVHLRPAPGAAPFVTAGDAVAAGQVLCTVEAMKVFTEVRAERPGTVAAVLVADGQEVEPGQPLLRLA